MKYNIINKAWLKDNTYCGLKIKLSYCFYLWNNVSCILETIDLNFYFVNIFFKQEEFEVKHISFNSFCSSSQQWSKVSKTIWYEEK